MLKEDLREFTYLAETADIESSVNFVSYFSMEIKIQGFRDSINKFVHEYITKILNYVPADQELFESLRAKVKRSYANHFLDDPYRLVYDEEVSAMRNGSSVSAHEKLKEIDHVTLAEVASFAKHWKKNTFTEGLISGNLLQETAHSIVEEINKLLSESSQPLAKDHISCMRPVNLLPGTSIIEAPLLNK